MSSFIFQTPGYEDLEVSTQIVIKEALARGLTVEILDRQENFIRLRCGDHVEYVKQATKTSKDSYVTFLIMENKHVTKLILEEHSIRVPKGNLYDSFNEATQYYHDFSAITCVVKPLTTNFGLGVSFVLPNSPNDFTKALKTAFSHDKSIIVEEYIAGKEYRLLVIGGKTVAVTHRVPANVVGDGTHTVAELIEIKNHDPLRTFGIPTPLNVITMGEVEEAELVLQDLTFQSILPKGQQIFLRKNSNISTGGDPIDFTDQISQAYKKIAEKAAAAVKAEFCGVDMIINDIQSKPSEDNYAIIELNFNPTLGFHNFPAEGKNRQVEKAVIDLLGF